MTLDRGWRWYVNGGIESSPFERMHCVPIAFANVSTSRRKARLAVEVADVAYGRVIHDGRALLARKGSSPQHTYSIWATLFNYRVAARYEPVVRYVEQEDGRWNSRTGYRVRRIGRPTLAQFARTTGRRGRWIVFTPQHAQAVVNGAIRGYASPRQRVRYAIRIENLSTSEVK